MPGLSLRSFFQNHPFMVASADKHEEGIELKLVVQPRRGWTLHLFQRALELDRRSRSYAVFFSGPHGLPVAVLDYGIVIAVVSWTDVRQQVIPANYCSGSSLHLFKKVVGKNGDGTSKLNRILHCGDFRACPAHIHHPLLGPEVMDAVTGQTKNRTIDTCSLDTTYLTPNYSFPSQHS
ncbi:DNA cross-link repair protein PSO2/SNM1 [Exophiala xenobiotica]|uniref:DNA cross-link repair protein PSO2/SNM1 n=1 Tax=Lithohypha guttulata TaxID=1690604 RepID=A0ABR0JZE2_9EURO|nr:DNA cross-link repair protein PSO2/SNM1 [Lithohypha guttulata]KAK5310854.1 DNA cross-link repair protein PSO2/SNM1 [Exophiala xenobiotica]